MRLRDRGGSGVGELWRANAGAHGGGRDGIDEGGGGWSRRIAGGKGRERERGGGPGRTAAGTSRSRAPPPRTRRLAGQPGRRKPPWRSRPRPRTPPQPPTPRTPHRGHPHPTTKAVRVVRVG